MPTIELYGDSLSGNCYKLQLACAQLGIDYTWHETDVLAGDTQTPEFLAINPNGKVPAMKLPDGRCLGESNAILWFLADDSELCGADAWENADILRWMFFEQYSHEPFIATSRFIVRYLGSPPERQAELEAKSAGGYRALGVMEQALAKADFMANNRYSIADIALYAYTHMADEGGFDLAGYPQVCAWLERVAEQPGYVPMRA